MLIGGDGELQGSAETLKGNAKEEEEQNASVIAPTQNS